MAGESEEVLDETLETSEGGGKTEGDEGLADTTDDDGGEALEGEEDLADDSALDDDGLGDDDSADEDDGGLPPLPDGYANWQEVLQKADAAREQERLVAYQRQEQAYQQAAFQQDRQVGFEQPQVAPQQQHGFQLPHQLSSDLHLAIRALGDPEAVAQLEQSDPRLLERAREVSSYTNQRWGGPEGYLYNPDRLVEEVVAPRLEQRFRYLESQLAEREARDFRDQHPELQDPQRAQEFLQRVRAYQADPIAAALESMKRDQALAERQAQSRRQQTKQRDQKAQARSARGKKKKEGQRRGKKPSETLPKNDRANANKIGMQVLKELQENGDI